MLLLNRGKNSVYWFNGVKAEVVEGHSNNRPDVDLRAASSHLRHL